MAWPAALTIITINGRIVAADVNQTPAVGFIRFTTPNVLRDLTDDVILAQHVEQVILDVNGAFTVDLPATNDPDIDPVDWAIKVFVNTDQWREQFFIQLDAAGPNPIEFADIPVATDGTSCIGGLVSCVTVAMLNASAAATLAAANAYTDAEIAAIGGVGVDGEVLTLILGVPQWEPAGGGGGVTSVNGDVGPAVILDAVDVGADPAGSAAAAQAAAIAVSLQKAANLSDLTNAATARTNLGLGNVDNTSDLNKPISTATQNALNLKADDSLVVHLAGAEFISGVKTFIANPVFGVNAISQVSITNLTTDLAAKADETVTITGSNGITGGGDLSANRVLSPTYGTTANTIAEGNDARFPASTPLLATNNLSDVANAATARTNLGLGNVDNTSDANKPISTATQAALDLKADETITLTAGIAMSGGGDLTANRTFDVDLGQTSTTVAEGRAPWFTYAPMPISGRYVYTTYGATGTVVPALDSARYTPFAVWDGFTATSISIEVTVLQATSVVRLGLYADDGTGLPGALITDFGTVSAASIGVKTISPGGGIVFADRTLYWLCAVVQVAGGVAALRTSNYHDALVLPSTTGVTNAGISAYVQAGVSGALGSPATAGDASGGPRFMLLIA